MFLCLFPPTKPTNGSVSVQGGFVSAQPLVLPLVVSLSNHIFLGFDFVPARSRLGSTHESLISPEIAATGPQEVRIELVEISEMPPSS
jgi:hypothetical protein